VRPVVRRFVRTTGLDDSALSGLVDDQVHELDLVLAVVLVVEDVRNRRLGRRPVKPDE
jgi:hypothetical protein